MRSREDVLNVFPPLAADERFRVISPLDLQYNCFAWAARDTTRRWDPAPTTAPTRSGVYWPDDVPLLYTMNAYLAAYRKIDFEPCETGDLEAGFEKIVIYVSADGVPSHAARQLSDGSWTSKLGGGVDIEHGKIESVGTGNTDPPDGVGNRMMGEPSVFLKRPL